MTIYESTKLLLVAILLVASTLCFVGALIAKTAEDKWFFFVFLAGGLGFSIRALLWMLFK